MRQTGHRRTDAVQMYKRPSVEHQVQVSRILLPPALTKPALVLQTKTPSTTEVSKNKSAASSNTTFTAQGNAIQNIHITIRELYI